MLRLCFLRGGAESRAIVPLPRDVAGAAHAYALDIAGVIYYYLRYAE